MLKSAPPAQGAVLDDAALLSRSSASTLSAASKAIEDETGVRVTVVTLRKLQLQPDAFAFADKLIETWYPTREEGDKKVVLLLVKASKEGALVAGPSAGAALKPLIESVATDTVPFYAEQEKYGEALTKALGRVGEALAGRVDPGPPERARAAAGSNFRSKQETADNKGKYVAVVGGLLVRAAGGWGGEGAAGRRRVCVTERPPPRRRRQVIAFIVPMVQYFGYVRKD